ncbi:MAG: SPOR domain-containing protein [Gammaproteobacteria bacterium]
MKQRLVGAIVLVALGVIFIPMLLEGPSDTLVPELEALPEFVDPGPERPLEPFPTADTLPVEPGTSVVETAPEPLSDLEPAPDAEPAPETDAAPLPEAPPRAAQAEQAPVPEASTAGSPAAAPTAKAPDMTPPPQAPADEVEAKPLGSWVVQLGSFSGQDKAMALRDKARQKGFTTQVEKVRINDKTFYRVRVGPFLERGEAEQTRQRLAKTFELEGRVLSYP